MTHSQHRSVWTRREALKLGATLTGGLLAAPPFAFAEEHTLPSERMCKVIESILRAKGKACDGVFSVNIERRDIDDVTLEGLPINPAFLINGSLAFQSTGGGRALMNGDLPLRPAELDLFTERLIAHDITVQAEHQHMFDLAPTIWFLHFRAEGEPRTIANGVAAALDATSIPLPQMAKEFLATVLPAGEMGRIVGGVPEIKSGGVVSFRLPRRERIHLGGVTIHPQLNVASEIAFQPLESGKAAAVCDFSLIAAEIQPVNRSQFRNGWKNGALYNQEIADSPQLYFSHHFKTGYPLDLAREIRGALNLMNVKFA